MPTHDRPLSPHLQIYQRQLTAVLSFLHRFTGVGLGFGTLVLVYWLIAAAAGPAAFATAQELIGSVLGRLLLFGWTIALFYHLGNGVRHLFWDAGFGLGLPAVYASGRALIAFTIVATLASWVLGYGMMP